MLDRLRARLADLRSSLWIVPSMIVAACVAAAVGLVELDSAVSPDLGERWPRLFGAGAEGARGLLSAIASSMITVAGVVFSITIVALSLTSSQYSSRVLRSFLGDRTNQTVLGVFVGVFAYCLVVLRTIRGGDEGAFVPSLAVLGGVMLAFAGVVVLIVFIHHIAHSIQASHIIANAADATAKAIDQLFPEPAEDDDESPPTDGEDDGGAWLAVDGTASGYVQHIGVDALLDIACELDLIVRVEPAVGDFVVEATPMLRVLAGRALSDDEKERLRTNVVLGRDRTLEQDPGFGLRQIVDVALKALSPGINDRTTAVNCIDYLGALFVRLAGRRFDPPTRSRDGKLRVVAAPATFASLFEEHVEEVRIAASHDPFVLRRLVGMLALVAGHTGLPGRRACLAARARATLDSAHGLRDATQRERVVQSAERLVRDLSGSGRLPAPPGG